MHYIMHHVWKSADFCNFLSLPKIILILMQSTLCTALIVFVYRFFKKRQHLTASNTSKQGQHVAMYKHSFFFVYPTTIPSYSVMKKAVLPFTTYVHQAMSGVAALFCKEKIIRLPFAFQDAIILTKAESVEEFYCSNIQVTKPYKEFFVPFFGNGLFLSTGQRWKSQRKIYMPLFHQDVLKEFVPVFDRQSKTLVDILKRRHGEKWIDIRDTVEFCTMDILCETFLGIKADAQTKKDSQIVSAIMRATQTMMSRACNPIYHFEMIFRLSKLGRQLKKDTNFIRSFAEQVIQRKKSHMQLENGDKRNSEFKRSMRNNFVDLLLDLKKRNSEVLRTDSDIRDELISFIFAGQDSTAAALAWTFHLIGLYPDIQRKIHEELDVIFGNDPDKPVTVNDLKEMHYIECVMKESQRLYPSIPYNGRYPLQDFNLCGQKIKKGSIVVIDAYDLHRDPKVFPNPEVFEPDRFTPEKCAGRSPYAYVPFSAGNRSCLGRGFAIMEEKAIIANVLRYFSLKSLEHRDKICPSYEIILRSPKPLKIKFSPRCIDSEKGSPL